jgi:hypothetical protein
VEHSHFSNHPQQCRDDGHEQVGGWSSILAYLELILIHFPSSAT